jgi:hypothetical protein
MSRREQGTLEVGARCLKADGFVNRISAGRFRGLFFESTSTARTISPKNKHNICLPNR